MARLLGGKDVFHFPGAQRQPWKPAWGSCLTPHLEKRGTPVSRLLGSLLGRRGRLGPEGLEMARPFSMGEWRENGFAFPPLTSPCSFYTLQMQLVLRTWAPRRAWKVRLSILPGVGLGGTPEAVGGEEEPLWRHTCLQQLFLYRSGSHPSGTSYRNFL